MQLKRCNCSVAGVFLGVVLVLILQIILLSGCDGFKLRDKKTSSVSGEIGQNDNQNYDDDDDEIMSPQMTTAQSLFASSLLKKNALRDLLIKKKNLNARLNSNNDDDSEEIIEYSDNDDDVDDEEESLVDIDEDEENEDDDEENDTDDNDEEINDEDSVENDEENKDDEDEDDDKDDVDEDNEENDSDEADDADEADDDVNDEIKLKKEENKIDYDDDDDDDEEDEEDDQLKDKSKDSKDSKPIIQQKIPEITIKNDETDKKPTKIINKNILDDIKKMYVEKEVKKTIEKPYVFEKVNYPTIDTTATPIKKLSGKIKPVTKVNSFDDDENEEKEEININVDEEEEEEESTTIFDFFGLFNQLKSEADVKAKGTKVVEMEQHGLFDWWKKLKSQEKDAEAIISEVKDKDNDDVPAITNLMSSFNQKLTNLFSFDDGSNDNDSDADDKINKKPKEILIKGKKQQQQPVKDYAEKSVAENNLNNAGGGESSDKKKGKKESRTATDEFEERLLNLPSFVPNYTKVNNIDCKRQGQIFQRQLRGQKIWALEMMDASAKIPSGLMRGNINQLGDFDLCVDIAKRIKVTEAESIRMRGKYCLAHVDVVSTDDDLKLPVHLMQGKSFLRSTRNDPSHFFPRFTTLNWGICLPSACTHSDAERILRDSVKSYNATGLKIHIDIDPDNCYVKQSTDWQKLFNENWQICATLFYFAFIIILTVMASLNDYWSAWQMAKQAKLENSNSKQVKEVNSDESMGLLNQILMSFSIKRTGLDLFNKRKQDNDSENVYIDCINGIKGIGTILLYLSFKLISIARTPYTNRIYLTELFNSPWSIFLRTSFLFTDIFLLVSGILAGLAMSKDIKLRTSIPWFRRFVGRFIRIIPGLLAIVLFYAWIWEHLDTGPQWGDLIIKNSKLCKNNLWQNIFNVQNFYNFDQICAPHTYQIAIDTQMYLLAPVIVWLLHAYPTFGLGLFGIIQAFSAAMRYSTTINNRLSLIIFHGMKLSQLHRTANLSFLSPLHRATPFLTGLGLGVMIYQMGKNIKLPRGAIIIGWFSAVFGIILCFSSQMNTVQRDYHYEPIVAAQYTAWSSLVWSISLSWIIFACHYGYGGFLNHILSTKLFIYLSKLTYSIYLLEFIIFFWFVASTSKTEYFQLSTYLDWTEILITIVAATVFTLLFDLPMQKIKNLLINHNYNKKKIVADSVINEIKANNNDNNVNASNKKENDDLEQLEENEEMHRNQYTNNDADYEEDEEEDEDYNMQDEIDNDNVKNDAEDDIEDIWAERKANSFGVSRAIQSSPRYDDDEEEEEVEDEEDDEEVSEEKEVICRPLAGSGNQTPPSNLRRWRYIVHDD